MDWTPWIPWILAGVYLFLLYSTEDVQDTIDHHRSVSFISKIKNGAWRAWFSSSWLRRYNERDPSKGWRKYKVLGITVSVEWGFMKAVWDAWHFFKTVRVLLMGWIIGFHVVGVVWYWMPVFCIGFWGLYGLGHGINYGWLHYAPEHRPKLKFMG